MANKTDLKPGDNVTMTVDVSKGGPAAFLAVAAAVNAGAVGVVKAVYTGRAAKRYGFNEPCCLVEFPGTAWSNGVVSMATQITARPEGAATMPKETKFETTYKALTDLADDTGKEVGTVLCRVINGVDVSFTRTKSSTFIKFGVIMPDAPTTMSLYEAAEYISTRPTA